MKASYCKSSMIRENRWQRAIQARANSPNQFSLGDCEGLVRHDDSRNSFEQHLLTVTIKRKQNLEALVEHRNCVLVIRFKREIAAPLAEYSRAGGKCPSLFIHVGMTMFRDDS